MSLDSFANLKASIADHLGRSNLTDFIPDFITIAEARHKREIRIREMLTRGSITVDARQISLPTGLLEAKSLKLLTSPVTLLKYKSQHELDLFRSESTGKPEYFTINNEIEFDIEPDSSYSGEILYYKAETALSDSNTSNNILSRAPDAYLYGALVASAPFLMNDERLTVWNELYNLAVTGLANSNKQDAISGPLVSRATGDNP